MTIKNTILKQSNGSHGMGSPALSFRVGILFLIVFALSQVGRAEQDIDPISLLEPFMTPEAEEVVITIPSNFVAKADQKTSSLLIAQSPTTDVSRKLWQARITSSKDSQPEQGKNEFQQKIEQINSVVFESKNQNSDPPVVAELSDEVESEAVSAEAEVSQGQGSEEVKAESSDGRITDQTLEIFKDLSQRPEQLQKPFELAEILFKSNHLSEAAKCYQETLTRMNANETSQIADKAWVLLQIGNCLRNTDPSTARQMYSQLIAEYPDSPWSDLAEARVELIDWYLKDKPDTLINQRSSQAL